MFCPSMWLSFGVAVLLHTFVCFGAGFGSFPSHCFLLDIDIFYNSSDIQDVDLPVVNASLRHSRVTQFVTVHWLESENKCKTVDASYLNLRQRLKVDDRFVLSATYVYEVRPSEDGKSANTDIRECIDKIFDKFKTYIDTLNLLSSFPDLTDVSGKKIKPYATSYGKNIRPCCLDGGRGNCCPKGSTFVPDKDYDNCDCDPGFYYKPSKQSGKCRACAVNTYQSKSGMTACEPCPEGMATASEGATTCTPISDCENLVNWEIQGIFHWKNTRTGTRVKHECPYGPDNAVVERECYLDGHAAASWGRLNTSVCNSSNRTVSLLELSKRPVNETNAFEVSQKLVAESLVGQELNAYDLALLTSSLGAVIDVKNTLMTVSDNFIKVLDHILMAEDETLSESQKHDRTTTRLLNFTEMFAENIPLLNGSLSLVGTNIEISVQIPTPQMIRDGFSFNVKSKDFTKILSDKSSTHEGSRMTVSPESFQSAKEQASERLICIVYRNRKLFPMVHDVEELEEGSSGSVLMPGVENQMGSVVMAGKFKDVLIEGVENAVELSFVTKEGEDKKKAPVCVYWDFEANVGFGNWSTEGCRYVGTILGRVTCRCNHMTNFAMLLTADPERHESDEDHRMALSIISFIGCGVSLLAVSFTLLTYSVFRYLRRSNAQHILCHLCVALIGLLVSFLVAATRTPNTTICRVFSIFVHYFLLATLAWMGVEGINMYLALVKVMSAYVPRFMRKAVVISWGIPVVIVAIAGFLAFDDYSSENSCFIHGLAFYISVFAPAIAILLCNFIMFGLTIFSLSRMGGKVSQENKFRGYQRAKVALAIMVLLGLTWVFGAMAIGDARLLFQYVFCIFNSFQGAAIFWFHCVCQPEVRECWVDFVCRRDSRARRYTASTMVAATAASKISSSSPNFSSYQRRITPSGNRDGDKTPNPGSNIIRAKPVILCAVNL